jgi:glycosyltransferase involved in cell wall biosynthesis
MTVRQGADADVQARRSGAEAAMKICAVIPVWNEADVIAGVVAAVKPQVAEVLVVDDGSTDGTGDRAVGAGAVLLRLDTNQGKGVALRRALAHIAHRDFTHVLFMDGDGQHRPEDIPLLIERAVTTGADLILGVRRFDRALMPPSRHFSNTVGSWTASRLVGRTIPDSQTGFRLVRLESLRRLRLRARRYEIEMEVLIKLCAQGASLAHVPVTMVYHGGQATSKMHPVRDTIRICLWSLAFRFLKPW